jgi:hypothetical protein
VDATEFFDKVQGHPDLEGVGVEEGDEPAVLVRHVPSDSKYRVLLSTVAEHTWETLEGILTGQREARVLSHMTRVVGYFSRVENWNRSKVGELHGRQRGDYSMTERSSTGPDR